MAMAGPRPKPKPKAKQPAPRPRVTAPAALSVEPQVAVMGHQGAPETEPEPEPEPETQQSSPTARAPALCMAELQGALMRRQGVTEPEPRADLVTNASDSRGQTPSTAQGHPPMPLQVSTATAREEPLASEAASTVRLGLATVGRAKRAKQRPTRRRPKQPTQEPQAQRQLEPEPELDVEPELEAEPTSMPTQQRHELDDDREPLSIAQLDTAPEQVLEPQPAPALESEPEPEPTSMSMPTQPQPQPQPQPQLETAPEPELQPELDARQLNEPTIPTTTPIAAGECSELDAEQLMEIDMLETQIAQEQDRDRKLAELLKFREAMVASTAVTSLAETKTVKHHDTNSSVAHLHWEPAELQQQLMEAERMLECDITNAELKDKVASIRAQLQQADEEAQPVAISGAETDRESPVHGFVRMAQAYLRSDNIDGAREAIRKAAALQIDHPDVVALTNHLERVSVSQPFRTAVFKTDVDLGMGLEKNPLWRCDCLEGNFAVVVSSLNKTSEGLPGAAEQTGVVAVGDFVVRINDTETHGMNRDDVIGLIGSARRLSDTLSVHLAKFDTVSHDYRQDKMLRRHATADSPGAGTRAQELHGMLLSVSADRPDSDNSSLPLFAQLVRMSMAQTDRCMLIQMGAVRKLTVHVQNRDKARHKLRNKSKELLNQLVSPVHSVKKAAICDEIVQTRDLVCMGCIDNDSLRIKALRTLVARYRECLGKSDENGNMLSLNISMELFELDFVKRVMTSPPSAPGQWLNSKKSETLSLFVDILRHMSSSVIVRSTGPCPALTETFVKQVTAACEPALELLLREAVGNQDHKIRQLSALVLSHLVCSFKIARALSNLTRRNVYHDLRNCVKAPIVKGLALKTLSHLAASLHSENDLARQLATSEVGYTFLLNVAEKSNDKEHKRSCVRAVHALTCHQDIAALMCQDRKFLRLALHLGACKLNESWDQCHKADIQSTAISIIAQIAVHVDAANRLRMASDFGLLKELAACETKAVPQVQRKCDAAIGSLSNDAPRVQELLIGESHKNLLNYLSCGQPHTTHLTLSAISIGMREALAASKFDGWVKTVKHDTTKMEVLVSVLSPENDACSQALTPHDQFAAVEFLHELIKHSAHLNKLAVDSHALRMCSMLLADVNTPDDVVEELLKIVWTLWFGTQKKSLSKDVQLKHMMRFLLLGKDSANLLGLKSLVRPLALASAPHVQGLALRLFEEVARNDTTNKFRLDPHVMVNIFAIACTQDERASCSARQIIANIFVDENTVVEIGSKGQQGILAAFSLVFLAVMYYEKGNPSSDAPQPVICQGQALYTGAVAVLQHDDEIFRVRHTAILALRRLVPNLDAGLRRESIRQLVRLSSNEEPVKVKELAFIVLADLAQDTNTSEFVSILCPVTTLVVTSRTCGAKLQQSAQQTLCRLVSKHARFAKELVGVSQGVTLLLSIADASCDDKGLRLDAARALAHLMVCQLSEEYSDDVRREVLDGLVWILLLARSDKIEDFRLVTEALYSLSLQPWTQDIMMSMVTDWERFGGYEGTIQTLITMEKKAREIHGGIAHLEEQCLDVRRRIFNVFQELSQVPKHHARLKDDQVHTLCGARCKDVTDVRLLSSLRTILRQLDPDSTVDDVVYPGYWDSFPAGEGHIEVEIPKNSPEWNLVSKLMNENIHQHGSKFGRCPGNMEDPKSFPVERIVRIQDKSLWRDYRLKHDSLSSKYGSSPLSNSEANRWLSSRPILTTAAQSAARLDTRVNEHLLFHGTDQTTAEIIKRTGFDSRVGHLGGMFGGGTYFAENSSKSNQYIPGPEDRKQKLGNPFQMLFCRVLLGDIHLCKNYVQAKYRGSAHNPKRRPPTKPYSAEVYDSVLGESERNGATAEGQAALRYREFIVYSENQAYPEYQVWFKRSTKRVS